LEHLWDDISSLWDAWKGILGNIETLRYVQKRVCTRGAAKVKNFSMMHDLLASFKQSGEMTQMTPTRLGRGVQHFAHQSSSSASFRLMDSLSLGLLAHRLLIIGPSYLH
jgi:hypothetical protein